jgi:exodeoxyribonuclease-3
MTKIYSWNVNGIRAVLKKNALEPFIATEQPDVLCLQETKAKQDQVELELPGYRQFWYSAEKPGYSGTAIFTKQEPLQVMNGFPQEIIDKYGVTGDTFGDPNKEGRVLAAEFDGFWLITVYTPNAKDDLGRLQLRQKQWDPAFLAYCKQLEQSKPVVFCGDLNVAHTEDDRQGFQNFVDAGFVDTLRMFKQGNGYYTWWSHFARSRERNVGWRIDYFLASKALKDKIQQANIHPGYLGSDHCPVSVTLDI